MPPRRDSRKDVLSERLGIPPLPPQLLAETLTHASYLNESDATSPSNERLEFLGDAVLGFVIADILFRRFPDATEGALTKMRADIVRGRTLAQTARRLYLGEHIILGKGEEAAGGRERERNLAGLMEALVGATFIAHGIRTTRAMIRRILKPELAQVAREGASLDPKSNLQQVVQRKWRRPPEYVTVESGGTPNAKFRARVLAGDKELGHGSGPTKRAAQQEAARHALTVLAEGGSEG
ncbi:MAG TPA: ribonuclease III [Dehalococcoidia bacterium]|nr:ribonuclease III [Dehalococcoidia bacterium]